MTWILTALLALVAFGATGAPAAAAPGAAPWLFVTDIHYDPTARGTRPSPPGSDSNGALLESTLAQMRRVDPHPPVVVIGGDYFAHNFDWSHAAVTMAYLARRFNATFPDAQFVITLGNEDSPCGDYGLPPHAAFLRQAARAWEPLVNRNGAAPGFATSFARDAFYVTRLPIAHTQAVVVDDVYWSPRYHSCAVGIVNPAPRAQAELTRALHASSDRHWILLHIPPGIDAYSTWYIAHHLLVVPFLDPHWRDTLLAAVADPAAHVTLVVAAHTHKFSYRIAGTAQRPVPMLLVPSVSPVFLNAPGFLTAAVDPDGTLRDVDTYAYDGHAWHALGGFRALGVTRLTGPALVDLHRRLAGDAGLRARFGRLYEGGGKPEITPANWRTYWCASSAFTSTAFTTCDKVGGVSLVTARGVKVGAVAVGAFAVTVVALIAGLAWGRRRRAS